MNEGDGEYVMRLLSQDIRKGVREQEGKETAEATITRYSELYVCDSHGCLSSFAPHGALSQGGQIEDLKQFLRQLQSLLLYTQITSC